MASCQFVQPHLSIEQLMLHWMHLPAQGKVGDNPREAADHKGWQHFSFSKINCATWDLCLNSALREWGLEVLLLETILILTACTWQAAKISFKPYSLHFNGFFPPCWAIPPPASLHWDSEWELTFLAPASLVFLLCEAFSCFFHLWLCPKCSQHLARCSYCTEGSSGIW